MRHEAFTLVEALVVIVILAIIAAVLFPVFARKETPHRPSCSSNLKQIALGYHQYAQDYNEKLPPVKSASGGWAELLQPYLRSTQLF